MSIFIICTHIIFLRFSILINLTLSAISIDTEKGHTSKKSTILRNWSLTLWLMICRKYFFILFGIYPVLLFTNFIPLIYCDWQLSIAFQTLQKQTLWKQYEQGYNVLLNL